MQQMNIEYDTENTQKMGDMVDKCFDSYVETTAFIVQANPYSVILSSLSKAAIELSFVDNEALAEILECMAQMSRVLHHEDVENKMAAIEEKRAAAARRLFEALALHRAEPEGRG